MERASTYRTRVQTDRGPKNVHDSTKGQTAMAKISDAASARGMGLKGPRELESATVGHGLRGIIRSTGASLAGAHRHKKKKSQKNDGENGEH